MDAPYQPIACDLHDQILAYATLRRLCQIHYRDQQGQPVQVQSLIQDVYSRQGAEYMKLPDGTTIRLDRLTLVQPV